MSIDPRLQAVEHCYDFHPISPKQIFDAVAARGIERRQITEEVLQLHDQDHYGGTSAVHRLMAQAGVTATGRVLDEGAVSHDGMAVTGGCRALRRIHGSGQASPLATGFLDTPVFAQPPPAVTESPKRPSDAI